MSNNNINSEENEINLSVVLDILRQYWKYYLLSVVLCLIVGVVYLQNKKRIYQVTAKVLLKDNEKGTFSSQTDMLADFGFQATNSNVENEIEVLNSKSVVQMAVMHSGLYVRYFLDGTFSASPIYKGSSPLHLTILEEDLDKLFSPLELKLTLDKDSLYNVSYRYKNEAEGLNIETLPVKIEQYPYVLNTEKGNIMLTENTTAGKVDNLIINVYPVEQVVMSYKGALMISPISKTASVSIIAINDAVPMNGVDFINSLIYSYNRQSDEDKNILARKTEEFISARIKLVGEDLKGKEKYLAEYKIDNKILNPEMDAPQVLQGRNEYSKKLEEVDMLLQQAEYLLAYIQNPDNDMQAIPTVLGMSTEASLVSLVSRYNLEVANRNQLLLTATEENPVLQTVTDGVKRTQKDIIEALHTIKSSLALKKSSLQGITNKYERRAAATPGIERMYTDLVRERDIKSQLYVMLLQKYEENALALALTVDNLKCIDFASVSPTPVSPNKKMVMLISLLMGLAIPSFAIYMKEVLRTRINSLETLEKMTTIPIIGSIPVKKGVKTKEDSIVVKENVNDVLNEAFRSLRTNLQFLLQDKGKVVMFTSTKSGEGKTFVSSNFAISQAVLGKKVLLMGLDIRRPRLADVFNITRKKPGITSYLMGSAENTETLDTLIVPSGVVDSLDLLPAGIVPPNPAELLAKNNLAIAIEYLSKKYDYIIMDTAPVGLVSDSILIGKLVDTVVFVARNEYTEKSDIQFLNSLVESGKMESLSIVFNAESVSSIQLSRRGKYRYGYSYYGYSDEPNNQ